MEDIQSALSLLDVIRLSENCVKNLDSDLAKDCFSLNFKLLLCIYRLGSPSQSTVVSDIKLAKSNVAIFAKKLIADGLIETKDDVLDKRVIYYSLTIKGTRYVEDKLSSMSKVFTYLAQTKQDKLKKNITNAENMLQEIERESRNVENK